VLRVRQRNKLQFPHATTALQNPCLHTDSKNKYFNLATMSAALQQKQRITKGVSTKEGQFAHWVAQITSQ